MSLDGMTLSPDMHAGIVLGLFAGIALCGALRAIADVVELAGIVVDWWRERRGRGARR